MCITAMSMVRPVADCGRAALVASADELLAQGSSPTLGEIADHARVSRTAAYRYFSSVDALVEEVFFDRDWPSVDGVFALAEQR